MRFGSAVDKGGGYHAFMVQQGGNALLSAVPAAQDGGGGGSREEAARSQLPRAAHQQQASLARDIQQQPASRGMLPCSKSLGAGHYRCHETVTAARRPAAAAHSPPTWECRGFRSKARVLWGRRRMSRGASKSA
jgi:hypothetical protein